MNYENQNGSLFTTSDLVTVNEPNVTRIWTKKVYFSIGKWGWKRTTSFPVQ